MATPIQFTDNYNDLSTDRGFQFRFNCERCGNGYMSSFQPNAIGLAGDAMRAAGGLLGGFLGRAAESAYDVQRMVGGPQHDAALRHAVEEIRPLFNQCQRCGQWVCEQVCWNTTRNQCVHCSPKMDQEVAAIESEGTIYQLRQQSYSGQDMKGGTEMKPSVSQRQCPRCHAEVPVSQKFCGECGANTLEKPTCATCGHENEAGTKFCGECGTKL